MIDGIDTNLWITANAGSGKTTQLVNRFLLLLNNNVKSEEVLCITYTEAGAKEMKNRIIKSRASSNINIDRKKLRISTIHSFCKRLLQENNIIDDDIKILNDDPLTMEKIVKIIISKIDPRSQESSNRENQELNNELKKTIKILASTENIDAFNELIKNIINKQNSFLDMFVNISNDNGSVNLLDDIKINDIPELMPSCVRGLVNKMSKIHDFGIKLQQELQKQDIKYLKDLVSKILGRHAVGFFSKIDNDEQLYLLKNWENIVLTDKKPRKSLDKLQISLIDDITKYYVDGLKQVGVDGTYAALCLAYIVLKEYQSIKQKMGVITYDDLLFQALQALENDKIK